MPDKPRRLTPRQAEQQRIEQEVRESIRWIKIQEQSNIAQERLKVFFKACWPTIRPGTPFQDNWHVDCICEHLEALFRREIRKLIINLPPRMLKSSLISVVAPAWRWLKAPEEKFLCASFGRQLALRDSRYCRNLIASQWYQSRWPDKFKLAGDQNEKGRFENDRGGFRIIASVEGGVLGEGGSVRLYDDPNDLEKMISEPDSYPQSVREWYSGTAASRSIDPKTDIQLCVQQRASYGGDLTEYLLELGGWDHLVIPNEYDGRKTLGPLALPDPRVHPGDLMFPNRLGPEETAILKREQRAHYCTPGYTPILMADWSEKRIEDVKVGDELIGYVRPDNDTGKKIGDRELRAHTLKTVLAKCTVTDISVSTQMVYEYTLTSGRTVHCTKDHKWYRSKGRNRAMYLPLKTRSRLHSVYTPPGEISPEEQRLYDWLGGMIDGEGSCAKKNLIAISQSSKNPEIQAELERVLSKLGFSYNVWRGARDKEGRIKKRQDNPKWSESGIYWINGGRSSKVKILKHCHMVKRQRIIDTLWMAGKSLSEPVHRAKDKKDHHVISSRPIGEMVVYGLTTTTGNYVAWGFASQNSGQYNQIPSMTGKSGLRREWFRFWTPAGTQVMSDDGTPRPVRVSLTDGTFVERIPVELPKVFEQVVHSLDCAFKDESQNDYVADHVWGRVGANTYMIAREHGHFAFPETLAVVRRLSAQYPAPEKLVEDKANGSAVIQTLKNEIPGLIPINPEGGKWSRVAAISGYVEAGNVYLPHPDLFPWVWELLAEFSAGPAARHDDDTDAMSQALRRLYDGHSQSGVPEFRVEPRIGEPQTAAHVQSGTPQPDWRKYVALIPGRAALWLAETQSGSLRVLQELDLDRMDAGEVGRKVAEMSLPYVGRPKSAKQGDSFDIFMPKEAFVAIEPVGSWAEMMESALLAWSPTDGDWDARLHAKAVIKEAKVRCELVEQDPVTALDRLRTLLQWAPPDWTPLEYDRKKAFALAERDLVEYHRYMGAVEGRVEGEWPKLKIFPQCQQLVAQMGTLRRDRLDEAPPFVEALLLGVSAPRRFQQRDVVDRPFIMPGSKPTMRNQRLLAKKFALR